MVNVIDINGEDKSISGPEYLGGGVSDSVNESELAHYLDTSLQDYKLMRKMHKPIYSCATYDDWWEELDRLEEMRPKPNREDWEYRGNSNIVLGDFHRALHIKTSKQKRALFNGGDLFTVKARKPSTEQSALLAKKLGVYNIDCVRQYEREVTFALKDRNKYGTCVVYTPWTDDRVKYTDFRNIKLSRVFINPGIENIQDQELIFIQNVYSFEELKQMEADGLIYEGMPEHLLTFYTQDSPQSGGAAEITRKTSSNDTRLNAFEIFLVYKRMRFEDGSSEIYEIFYNWHDRVIGMRPYPGDDFPLLKSTMIPVANSFYGIGMGNQMYSACIAKMARVNQKYDKETNEIFPAIIYDSKLCSPDVMKRLRPNSQVALPNFAMYRSTYANPIMSSLELFGSRPANQIDDMSPLMENDIMRTTGATEITGGEPTHSQADRTAAGMTLIAQQSEERIGADLSAFQDEVLRPHIEMAYINYQKFLVLPDELQTMFDVQELIYQDQRTGQYLPIMFNAYLEDVDFIFLAAERIRDNEVELGKLMRYNQYLSELAAMGIPPALEIIQRYDWAWQALRVADLLNITDQDRMFPPGLVPIQELVQVKQQVGLLQQQTQLYEQAFINAQQEAQATGDVTGSNLIQKAMNWVQGMWQKMTGG